MKGHRLSGEAQEGSRYKGNGNFEVTIERPQTAFRSIIGLFSAGGPKVSHKDWASDLDRIDDEEMK